MHRWFPQLFGFIEGDYTYKQVKNRFVLEEPSLSSRGSYLTSRVNGKRYLVGDFQCMTVLQLGMLGRRLDSSAQNRVRHIASDDVFMLHCDKENSGAMFMAASQFNCLEFSNPWVVPENGVTDYDIDRTQGPACAIAGGPAAVYRNYFATKGETGQINNLDEIEKTLENDKNKYFVVKNGYVDATEESLKRLNHRLKTEERLARDLVYNLKIGVHIGVQVPFETRSKVTTDSNTVSQTYCAAISCAYTSVPIELWEPFARLILVASYKATLYAAVVAFRRGWGSSRVYLTFLGGGVFRNRMEWITDAIIEAITSVQHSDLDIFIVHYKEINQETQTKIDSGLIAAGLKPK